ncbi:MAG: SnoaL-like domain-containing protein [Gammaproteobacteria bacterium]|nr:SnoaL-like domain-containing protein [Gammaproteobacteria bacterium]MBT6139163.1 SnoaL-like domain-containing protein [Rhodospirillaceae bacterium]MBT7369146.1 SnoaL-like domain-containing protein [Gammaproteobacteria bacterium]
MADIAQLFSMLKDKPDYEYMRTIFDRYRALMLEGDVDGICNLFAPNAVWEEPVGTTPAIGHEAIRARYAAALSRSGGTITMVPDGVPRIAGHRALANSIAYAGTGDNRRVIETSNVIECDEDGLITEMKVYIGPNAIKPAPAD